MRSFFEFRGVRRDRLAAVLAACLAAAASASETRVIAPPEARADGQFGFRLTVVPDVDGDGADDFAVSEPKYIFVDGRHPDSFTDGRVHIYSGRTGTLLHSIARPHPNDFFGWNIAGVPDVDGDGRGDLIITNYQRVYIHSGSTGALIRTIMQPDTADPALSFPGRVTGIGDLDGDGRGDVLIGATQFFPELNTDPDNPFSRDPAAGVVLVYSGATGEHIRTLRSPRKPMAWTSGDPTTFGHFGFPIAAVPDLNGDGVPDIAVGEAVNYGDPRSAPLGYRSRVYVFSGRTGRLMRTLTEPRNRAGTNFGFAIAGVEDLDGDNRGDIIVGAPLARPGDSGVRTGLVYVFSGREGRFIRQIGPPQLQEYGRFGESVAGVPDANGDGYPDILIGASREGVNRPGRAYLHSGRSGTRLRGFVSGFRDAEGWFGSVVAALEDTDGNGRPELLIAAPYENPNPDIADSGGVYMVRIQHQGVVDQDPVEIRSPQPRELGFFGAATEALDDLDGDGVADFAVSEPAEIDSRGFDQDEGRVYIHSGATGQPLGTIAGPANTMFGSSVAALEDVDGDGIGDIAIAAPFAINNRQSTGRVHIYSGATLLHIRTIGTGYLPAGSEFALAVKPAGDADGDGLGDVAVSAHVRTRPGSGAMETRIYVYSGATGELIRKLGPAEGLRAIANFQAVGDLNADGHDDLVVVDARAVRLGGGRTRPHAYLVSGRSGTLLRAFAGATTSSRTPALGRFITTLPDQDGDGRPELVLSDAGAGGHPVFHVFSPRTSRRLWTTTPAEPGALPDLMRPGPDLDADRIPDFVAVVGGRPLAAGTPRHASVRAISSVTGRTVRQWTTPVWDPMHDAPGSIAVLPDAVGDGDSLPGVAIGVPREDAGSSILAGKVYFYRP